MRARASAWVVVTALASSAGCGQGSPPDAHRPAVHGGVESRSPTGTGEASETGSQTSRGEVPRGFAYEVVELASGRVVQSARADQLDVAVSPGSIAKVLATIAAVEAGVLDAEATIVCPRTLRVEGHVVDCVHPDLGHPLTAADALAHSCNGFFAALGRRLPRAAFDRVLVAAGLAPLAPDVPTALGVLGLEGVRASAREWRAAFVQVVLRARATPDAPAHRIVLEGLRRAASEGTASALAARHGGALAKTGTATLAGGQTGGVVVAVFPALQPTWAVVGVAAGASGRDAAALVAERLSGHSRAPETPTAGASSDRGQAGEDSRPLEDRTAAPVSVRVGRLVGGPLEVRPLALEAYVAAVVAAEAPPNAPRALTEALAVLARTFALAHWGRHASEGYDLCDTTHCQAMGTSTPMSSESAAATAGLVLVSGDDVARAHYSASCGGSLADPETVWHGKDVRAKGGRVGPDPAPHAVDAWTADVSRDELEGVLARLGFRGGRLRRVRVASQAPTGQVRSVHVEGLAPDTIDAEVLRIAIGRSLGWQLIKSSTYTIVNTARGVRFTGRGKGHGVGFCVAGASVLAAANLSRDRLLETYFPGLAVVPLAPPPQLARAPVTEVDARAPRAAMPSGGRDRVSVMMPAALAVEGPAITTLVQKHLAQLRARLGRVGTLALRVRVHPTRESYARATQKPWWTSATQHREGGDVVIDVIPLRYLERRGVLESTIAHELVHALTSPVLATRPMWVREGVAAYFAGEPGHERSEHARGPGGSAQPGAGPSGERLRRTAPAFACPSDAEFIMPASATSHQAAYLGAAVCVREALSSGVDWRDLDEATRPGRTF